MKGDPRCILINITAVDEEENPITDLKVSLLDKVVKPLNPDLTKVYNFTLKAIVDGGDFIITTNKTLIVNRTKIVNSVDSGSVSDNNDQNSFG